MNFDVDNHSTCSGAKVTRLRWSLACVVAAVLCCNGCFVIMGTGNVKTGPITQTGTKDAWKAFGGAVGEAGGTAIQKGAGLK